MGSMDFFFFSSNVYPKKSDYRLPVSVVTLSCFFVIRLLQVCSFNGIDKLQCLKIDGENTTALKENPLYLKKAYALGYRTRRHFQAGCSNKSRM